MQTLRQRLTHRLEGMKSVRSDYEDECRDIARYAQPARTRFLSGEKNKGGTRRTRNAKLLDPHGIEASRTLTNGMTSGLSSASRPWFMLKLKDDDLNDQPDVRAWLGDAERRMYDFLSSTNFYGAAKSGYAEMGLFGTEACVMQEHWQHGMVFHGLTFGEYWLGLSDAMEVDTLYRYVPLSVRQAVMQFGKAVSTRVMSLYDASNYAEQVEYYHAIEPNGEHDPSSFTSKPWRSVYWEEASNRDDDVIERRGYSRKPFWAARWDVTGGDTYGTSPGMEALPALRELQLQTRRRNQAIDAMVNPEKIVKAGIRLTGEPGRIVTTSQQLEGQVAVPYLMPYQAVQAIGGEADKCRNQVSTLMFADLFNAITNMQGIQPRNVEEIAARNEEKLTQLGPVIERVSNEKLEPAIDRVFDFMLENGFFKPVPEALAGMDIDVEFVSILSQMQRLVGIGQIERTVQFVGGAAAAFPEVIDKLNPDAMIDEYAYRAGTPSRIIRGDKEVEAIRAQRAQQQKVQQMAATMPAVKDGAQAAALLSQAGTGDGTSMLDKMLPA